MQKKIAIPTSIVFILLLCASLIALFSPFIKAAWLKYTLRPSAQDTPSSTKPTWSTLPSLQPPLNNTTTSTNILADDPTRTTVQFSGTTLAGTQAPLLRFTQSDFDRVVNQNKLIILYFYSNNDNTSTDELPEIIDAFNQLSTDRVIGFVVHINNENVTADELAITNTMRVNTPDTKIFVKYSKELFHTTDSWDQQTYLSQITQRLSSL